MASIQYDMSAGSNAVDGTINYSSSWHPFVTSINMKGIGGTADCYAYINKLTNMAGANQTLFISAAAAHYANTNWCFDDTNGSGEACVAGVADVDPTAIIYSTSSPNYTTNASNIAGYFTCGYDCITEGSWTNYAINGNIIFSGNSGWYIMSTVDSYNGQPLAVFDINQWSFLTWFATNAFAGTNSLIAPYANTPVGAVVHVWEQNGSLGSENRSIYFGVWAAGKSFGLSAWNAILAAPVQHYECAAVGDPFTLK
jgi:hypothetical protein